MDQNFNQIYYLFSQNFAKYKTSVFPKILLNKHFIFYNKSKIDVFTLEEKLIWSLQINEHNQVERRNQGNAVFSDGTLIFTRFKEGVLNCLTLKEGQEKWRFIPPKLEVSYGQSTDNIYVHDGNGFTEIDKSYGKVTRRISYSNDPKLEGFSSNGIIWCFDNWIIVTNSFKGELTLFNRITFDLIDRLIVDTMGIPESEDCIQIIENHLYVLGISSTLFIYEIIE